MGLILMLNRPSVTFMGFRDYTQQIINNRNMKKTTTFIFFFLCSFLTQAWAQDSPHWTVDSHDFQYDMTAYLSLTADGEAVTDYSNYEIAAFCDDELRGVAEIQTNNDKTYAYMRIRSNQASGDVITFKVYVKDIHAEVDVNDYSITFASMDVKGLPSSPVVLDFVPYKEVVVTASSGNDGMGSVAGGGTYNTGTTATVTATPNDGYHFVKWTNGTNDLSTDNPYTFNVTAEATVTAVFAPNEYTATFVLGNGQDNIVKTQAYKSELTAPAAPVKLGYTFKGWDPEVPATMPLNGGTYTAKWVDFEAVDCTSKVSTTDWLTDQEGNLGSYGSHKEHYFQSTTNVNGSVLYQTVSGLDNGTYTVVLEANASYTPGRGFDSDALSGDLGRALVYAGDVEKTIPVIHQTGISQSNVVTLENVIVSDGTLKMGLKKMLAGSNWHTIQIKTLTQTNNDQRPNVAAQDTYWKEIAQQINQSESYAFISANAPIRTNLTQATDVATVKAAITTFYAETPAFKAFADAKAAEFDATAYKYAAEAKLSALQTALAAEPTTATEATAAIATLNSARRAIAESHALAESVEGAEDKTSLIVNPTAADGINGWIVTLGQGSGGYIDVKNNEPWTDASDNATHNYFDGGDWGANAWDVTFSQDVVIPQGNYMLTAISRAMTEMTTYRLFAGEESVDMTFIGSQGGLYGRGWNDNSLEFTLDGKQTVKIGVQGITATIHNWMSFSNFRLVRLGDNEAFAQAKTALSGAITEAKALNKDDYVEDSQTALTDAITAAETALNAEDATSTTMGNAKTALATALEGLVTKAAAELAAAKKELQDEIANAQSTYDAADMNNPQVKAAADILKDAIDAATEALNNPQATTASIEAALGALIQAENVYTTTGIAAIYAKYGKAVKVYTLDGKKVDLQNGSLRKGLYIINGKKVMVK